MRRAARPDHPVSPMWAYAIATAALLAVVASAVAVEMTIGNNRPVGEGELFLRESSEARTVFEQTAPAEGADQAVRAVRNRLEVEAVSRVDADGIVSASTSPSLVGKSLANDFLVRMIAAGRFAAVAAPVESPITIDGVVEWHPGDVLYDVVEPLDDGSALVVAYDMSELLERRSHQGGVPPAALFSIGVGALFALLALVAAVARSRAKARAREVRLEADYLRRNSEALEASNRDLEEARQRAETALALAEEKNRIRSEFVLMINHELRTPLTGIVTGAEVLTEMGVASTTEAKEILAEVGEQAHRLEAMLGQMLAVARIENRGLAVKTTFVPVEELRRQLQKARQGLIVDLTDPGLATADMVTDATTLTQMVVGLVDNAYTHGASDVQVTLTQHPDFAAQMHVGTVPSEAMFVVVSDNGPGIDPAFLPRAFEKYEKHGFASGTGLGLYLVKIMAEAIGASISVASGRDGSRFAVGVPVLRAAERAV